MVNSHVQLRFPPPSAPSSLRLCMPFAAFVKLLHHIRELVSIPVFDQWTGYLYQVGQNAGLVHTPQCGGDIDLLVIDLDASAWTRLITGGLANHVLEFPNSAVQ
jgi:hypothetical protein